MNTMHVLDEGRLSPPPAGSEATEDGGQRYLDDKSASDLSDKYPAGPDRTAPNTNDGHGVDEPQANRDVSIDVRVTNAEREAVRRRARRLGVKPSKWARTVILDAVDSRRDGLGQMEVMAASTPSPELSQAVEQVRRVGVNLNQVLRRGGALDAELLREVMDSMDDVRAQLGDRTAL
ncbi:MAG: plasmid mobilization protein [Brevibacterium sp.]